MKRFLGMLLFMIISFAVSVTSLAASQITLVINGAYVSSDVAPLIINGRTMVPVRVISEYLGYRVDWEGNTQRVTISKSGGNAIRMWVGNDMAIVNGEDNYMDSPPVLRGGRTLVPIRFISESFGLYVHWDDKSRTVSINTSDNTGDADTGPSGLEQIYGVDNSAFMGTWVNNSGDELVFSADGRCSFSYAAGTVWGTYKVDSSGMATAYFDMEEVVILYYQVDFPKLYELYEDDLLLDTYTFSY